jgi:hypothetical protein
VCGVLAMPGQSSCQKPRRSEVLSDAEVEEEPLAA